jgi:hypothetical protein
MEAASHAFLRGYSEQQEKAPNKTKPRNTFFEQFDTI